MSIHEIVRVVISIQDDKAVLVEFHHSPDVQIMRLVVLLLRAVVIWLLWFHDFVPLQKLSSYDACEQRRNKFIKV